MILNSTIFMRKGLSWQSSFQGPNTIEVGGMHVNRKPKPLPNVRQVLLRSTCHSVHIFVFNCRTYRTSSNQPKMVWSTSHWGPSWKVPNFQSKSVMRSLTLLRKWNRKLFGNSRMSQCRCRKIFTPAVGSLKVTFSVIPMWRRSYRTEVCSGRLKPFITVYRSLVFRFSAINIWISNERRTLDGQSNWATKT